MMPSRNESSARAAEKGSIMGLDFVLVVLWKAAFICAAVVAFACLAVVVCAAVGQVV